MGITHLPQQPHLLLVNHASYLDAIVLFALLPPVPGYAFATKREFTQQPVIRLLMTGLGVIFVERFDARRSAEDVGLMADALRQGQNLVVFPEGTFHREAGLLPFHSGAFLAAAKAGVPIIVAGLRGTRTALRAGTWRPQRTRIELEMGNALAPASDDWSTAARLRTTARTAMAKLCGEFAAPG
jgi:1-acyl-sn-glycerol-3-phosphate acyltransferase